MQLHLIRHGQTNLNVKGLIQGWTDEPLNATGMQQARQATKQLQGLPMDAIFSSDLKRARQTAQIITKTLNLPIYQDWRLRERRFGQLELTPKDLVDWKTIDAGSNKITNQGVEPLINLDNRLQNFLDSLAHFSGQLDNVIIVSHGGTMNRLCGLLDPQHQFCRFDNTQMKSVHLNFPPIWA